MDCYTKSVIISVLVLSLICPSQSRNVMKRNLGQFTYEIVHYCRLVQGYELMDYGCYCGKGGYGEPMDNLDRLMDPKKHITDLANFLDVPYTDEFINDIVIKCSFKNLKDHKLDVCSIIDTDKKSALFRKGAHWVREVISMLLTQKTEYNSHGPMWELNLEYLRQPEEVEKLVGPRIFTTHLPFIVCYLGNI